MILENKKDLNTVSFTLCVRSLLCRGLPGRLVFEFPFVFRVRNESLGNGHVARIKTPDYRSNTPTTFYVEAFSGLAAFMTT